MTSSSSSSARPALAPGMRLVERIPAAVRGSHEAARNFGRYPFNGAVRAVEWAEDAADLEPGDRDLGPASSLDLERYGMRSGD